MKIVNPAITVTGLSKRFAAKGGPVEAVAGIDLKVGCEEIFGFLGPNGAGKTTTLRMLTTLLPIDAGQASVAGFDVARQPREVRSRIGYVSQLGGADELVTGREDLLLQGRLYGAAKADVMRRVEDLIRLLDLEDIAGRRVRTYSGGQRRRLDVALGIVHTPGVLFLDEPSTGLDPQNRANLWDHIRALRDRGTTVFLTTHYLEEADALCDRIAIIDHGTIVAEGTPRSLKHEVSGDAVVISLHDQDAARRASAELSVLPSVRERAVEGATVRLYVADGTVALPGVLRQLDHAGLAPRSLSLSEPTLDDVFLAKTGRSLRDSRPASAGIRTEAA